jgi:hypothetical protein
VSRYNADVGREIVPGYKIDCEHWSSVAVQVISEPENCHGASVRLLADARVRIQGPLEICLDAGAKAKSVTNNLPLLTVLGNVVFIFLSLD